MDFGLSWGEREKEKKVILYAMQTNPNTIYKIIL
jgi:hypothetical protein